MFWGISNLGVVIFVDVDVNGYQKGPNVYGRDFFAFQISAKGILVPMGSANTNATTPTYCDRTTSNGWQGYGCMDYVMQGINY